MRKRNGLVFGILLLALGFAMLTGCEMVRQTGEYIGVIGNYWEPRIGPQEVTTDAPIFRGPPVISIYPKNTPAAPLSALFYPMQVTQPTDNPIVLGRALGRIFWQTWSQAAVFPTFVYEEDATWPGLPRALAKAKSLDVDLIIRGEIPYFLSGGSRGTTSISMRLEIFEVEGGQRIWIMEHAGRMEPQPRRDYIIAHHTRRLPEEPAASIMTILACDLAMNVGQWNNNWTAYPACPW
ncbi:hypothetical protein [Desulfonatronum sp. SC1]|uniref:hypothetical protein n=1 Tax=Desulfonatronum sp. SC1 TaxID=2109626 RepID=UPI000D3195AC|nr:hypothetical protein [Desulfonatronum sp. SC1]PTN38719.1 hypothetical protein C6366_01945 [Desulfonatronum sp. SC1]